MALALSNFPAITITAKTTTITQIPENPKTLILKQCKTTKDLKQVHAHLIKTQLLHRPPVAESILESAALLLPDPTIDYALSIFQNLQNPDSSAYNVIIRGFTHKQDPEKALLLFKHMIENCVPPDEFSFSGVLKACSRLKAVKEGQQIHAQILKCESGYGSKGFIENSLIYMYASCGQMVQARQLFDKMPQRSVISWNSMFSGYIKCGYWEEVVGLFRKMMEKGDRFDDVTMISVLTACGRVRDIELGELIHDYVETKGLLEDVTLVTSLVDMYVKCGQVDTARSLFDKMLERDVVAWNAMISGYSQGNRWKEGLDLFHEMQKANVEPNEITMVSVLSGCAASGALETGKWVHHYIKKKNLKLTTTLGTALVDFYSKCGCVDVAVDVFNKMASRNVISWTVVIQGLANNGQGKIALEYFSMMLGNNIVPNDVTFIGVLTACSHAGLVNEGRGFFTSMTRDFAIEPRMEHYGCMVDMFGRAGLLDEAYRFIRNMPIRPNAIIWRTLLASCKLHKNVEVGEESFKQITRLEPPHSGDLILLSNLYASVGMEEDALRVRHQMKEFGFKKPPGCSLIELDGVVHEFLSEDSTHPHSKEIFKEIKEVMEKIKLTGYVPTIAEARLEADQDGKETSISHHSEKLALAFGLLRTPPGTTIRISKNLRICSDCHNAMKAISKVYDREIVIRDRNRFHHFKDGLCSCNNFW